MMGNIPGPRTDGRFKAGPTEAGHYNGGHDQGGRYVGGGGQSGAPEVGRHNTGGYVALLVAVLLSVSVTAQAPPQPAMTPCASVSNVTLVCDQNGPEDLIVVPGGRWVVASSMAGAGGINIIRVSDKVSLHAYPTLGARERYDARTYPGCPGPPAAKAGAQFTTHGLWLREGRNGVHTLYAVGHGTRESIEVFELDASGDKMPVLTWLGCAIAPEPVGLNSVRGLPDGGFIASNFLARGASEAERQKLFGGQNNGELWEWHAKSGWQKVPGSEASGANGLELSADGKWLYVAAWGSQSFFRLSRGDAKPTRQEVPLGFRVDNIRYGKGGSLVAAGQGAMDTEIVRIDPKTMKVTPVLRRPDDASFRAGTVAVEVGNQLWVGSFAGDRIAVLPAP